MKIMSTLMSIYLIAAGGLAASPPAGSLVRFEATERHMGVQFALVFYAKDADSANQAAKAAFVRIDEIDHVFSNYESESELCKLGRGSPHEQPVAVSDEFWRVIHAGQTLSEETSGAFDMTIGPLTKLWRRAHRRQEMPDANRLAEAKASVGYRFVELDEKARTVRLAKPNMLLDAGGIAKGYAADAALAVLKTHGVTRALVNASGDIAFGDPPPGKSGWKMGVAPLKADDEPSRIFLLANCASATSGDAYQHVVIDGQRFSHIVDPRTGLGLTQPSSVTVFARTCMAADSLASAVSVLGPKKGFELLDKKCGTAALVIRVENDQPKVYGSAKLKCFREVSSQVTQPCR
jgi:thiamine biosynthesis lipoprotein